MVRGRAWGKAAAGRPKLQEEDCEVMIHMAGDTYVLYRGKMDRGVWGRNRGHVVRGRGWSKAAAGRPELPAISSAGVV